METFKADWFKPEHAIRKGAAMKKLMLLAVLILAPGLDGNSSAYSNQAVAADVSRERPGARPGHEHGTEQQIIAPAERYYSNEKRLLTAAGPANELEVKRIKLIFLLMMSLSHGAPVH
ncbi:MAG: hypothetical protein ACXW6R_19705 [Candidatus Binatia bacterium]